ncbi:MAG TPA: tRNA (adenosine(37)-N6)-dimethylallyltransferase MiaA, partial [Dermatophilaceae bacterium]|nr:tRNA (adenosine(37)-N6)-dimethylallyltransferase MiaA [Dermatophilaceae bacterium]
MSPDADPPVLVAVVGPTASGKSELALRICERLGGEVVGADAFQLYRGMDIGTAKLTVAERRGIPHHQLDVLDVTAEASVAAYQLAARADLNAISARGRHPVLVGGSGLYLRAALDRLDIPPTDPEVRARWERAAAAGGPEAVYAVLADRDPVAAARIEPRNVRRVVRALEVIELTGRPFSASLPVRELLRPTVVVGLRPPRAALDARITARVERMWRVGLLGEVRALEALGLRRGRTASRALGYAQALAELDGAMTGAEARSATVAATSRFARRQESWFRPDPRITWFDPTADGGLAAALDHVGRAVARP